MTEEPASLDAASLDATVVALPPKRSLLRRLLRPSVILGVVAEVVVAGNIWMYIAIDNWSAEAEELHKSAKTTGKAIGEANATIEAQENLLALLEDQSAAAEALSGDLELEANAEKAVSDGYKEAALGFETCADQRAEAIATLWAGGSGSAQSDAAAAECAAAQSKFDSLAAGN